MEKLRKLSKHLKWYPDGPKDDGLGNLHYPIDMVIIVEDDRNYWSAVKLIVRYNHVDIEQVEGDWYEIDKNAIYLYDTEGSSGGGFYPGKVKFRLPLKHVRIFHKILTGKRNVKKTSFTFSG